MQVRPGTPGLPPSRWTTLALAAILAVVPWLGARGRGLPQGTAAPGTGRGTLEVQVVDDAGKPLPGTLVSVPAHRATTGPTGICRFNLLVGRYPILISKDGYRGRRVNAGVRPGETTTTRVLLRRLPPGPTHK